MKPAELKRIKARVLATGQRLVVSNGDGSMEAMPVHRVKAPSKPVPALGERITNANRMSITVGVEKPLKLIRALPEDNVFVVKPPQVMPKRRPGRPRAKRA